MKILVASNGIVVMSAHNFAFGEWEERDTINGVIVHKWKAEDENGNTMMYLIDENQKSIYGIEQPVFTVHEVDEIPEGAEQGKYLFVDGAFVENPDWVAPPKTDAERIAELEAQNITLGEQIANTELTMIENYEAQEEINAQTENALIEIYEMMEG